MMRPVQLLPLLLIAMPLAACEKGDIERVAAAVQPDQKK